MQLDFRAVGGRTYLLTVGCGVVTSLMRWFDHLDNGSYTAIITASVCAYITRAIVQSYGDQRADVQKTIAVAQASSPPSIVQQVDK